MDAICDAFEAAWLAGHEPHIEHFLAGGDPVHHDVLLQELLLAEWDLRRRQAQRADLQTYLERFPESRHAITDLWRIWNEEQADGLPDGPPVSAGDSRDGALLEEPGTLIDRYKLLEKLGEGGFGTVWAAEQREPVKRRVALKVIKLGMDTRQVVARFEAERQALALMDHANIAKVFDAGATETGRPYFVMELVRGIPITEYCDQERLTTQARLDLFMKVCHAIQHAHQKGIIHRDIKPSNILVTLHDGVPVPKVIDFGVAKAIQQELTEKTIYTQLAQFIGTPAYMSPEQAEMTGLDIDTRSDIYSLGVLLYELLTGVTPFDAKELMRSGLDEMRKIIREKEPLTPSSRLSKDLKAKSSEPEHGALLGTLSVPHSAVDRDLDWIVMKCLEKDRNRRYETANGLARDVERYLHDEPVQACPPSASYRLKKFVRRNKVAAAFVALLLVGVVALGISNIAIKRERDAKTTALARAQAISDLLQEMLASSNPDQVKGSKYTVRELLDDFSAGLGDQLAGEPEVEAAIRSVIGKSYWRLGVYDRAELHSKKALDLRRQVFGAGDERVADSLVDYAWSLAEQSRYAEAEPCVREALSIYRKHNSDPRLTVRALWSLQEFLRRQSRLTEAVEVASDALALAGDGKDSDYPELPNILHGLAEVKSTQGKNEEAEKLARRAVEMHRRLHGDHHPETAWGLVKLGQALNGQQKFADAEPPLREALAIFREYYTPEHPSIQNVSQVLASVLEAKGDRAGLETLAREVETAPIYAACAYVSAVNHRPDEAAEFVRKAALNAERLTDPNASTDALYYVAVAQLWLGDKAGYRVTCKALVDLPVRSANDLSNPRILTPCLAANALDDLSLPVKHAKEFIANRPNQRHFGLGVLGFAHYRAGQYKQAAEHIKEAIAAYPSRAPLPYDVINYQRMFLAMTQWQLGQRDAARRLLAETQSAIDQEVQSRSVPWEMRATFEVLRREAEALIGPKEPDEAPKK